MAAVLFRPDGRLNPKVVGRSAQKVAELAGFRIPEQAKVLVARETEAGPTRPIPGKSCAPFWPIMWRKMKTTC